MTSTFSIGAMAFYIALHVLLLIATAAYGSNDLQCGNMPAWACGSPFASVADRDPQNTSILSLALGVFTGLFRLMFEFFLMDYDILKGEGAIIGGVGFVIRAIGWVLVLGSIIGITLQIFGRR